MSDTCGPLFEMPLQYLDQSERSLKMFPGTFRWDSQKSSWILPKSGSMRNGELYARPMLERPTNATGSSSLPTPKAGDGERGRDLPRLRPDVSGRELATTVGFLATLPTPISRDHKEQTLGWTWERDGVVQEDTLPRAITSMTQASWGKYEPAIRRWENLTREVPEPTVPHKDKRRLNPTFVEWMMGLPAGHVTGHGLSAAKELKMLGNGAVPQQARSAITQLMERITQ